MYVRHCLLLDVTQRFFVITDVSRQPLRTVFNAWPLKMGPMSCPETSVPNYQSMLRNIPEERMSLSCRLFGITPVAGNINGRWCKGKKVKFAL
jgi:hypothetical protein